MVLHPQWDPTPIVTRPWWSVTLAFQSATTGPTLFTLHNLVTALENQTGIPPATPTARPYEFRIRAVRVWETTGANVVLVPINLGSAGGSENQYQVLTDVAARNHWASVGFKWPSADVDQALNTSTASSAVFAIDSIGDYTIHVDILFRFVSDLVTARVVADLSNLSIA